ncbi:unnamed protein product [Aphanomyces euteiches]|uniref:Major facilitator superfamily (MFS) profile domain-containing protein n=1 Tax=Aphanomyces euteiches TaxID=100861 RepID=A0A6G0WNS0_9STRA|nr:hypothetical protein Ae201684_013312 [Aphanomyces euteiches]KAH9064774.1 hypothetical protein Ae201684P_003556 [Aphanomyces euteiches]KAH9151289.1 hypothetical protein AeRB84_006066 [Aphanomyces euteiches]
MAQEDTVGGASFDKVSSSNGGAAMLSSPGPPPDGCSIGLMALVALPRVAIMMGWASQWAVMGPLLEILVSSSAVQLVQVIGPVCGLLIVPAIGVLSDSCTSRFGRRQPFILTGALLSIVAYILLMFADELGQCLGDSATSRRWTTAIVVLCYIWTTITLNIAMVPTTLLMADVVGSRQVMGSAISGLLSSLGLLVSALYIAVNGPAHQSLKSYLAILIALLATTCGLVCWHVQEQPLVYGWRGSVKASIFAVLDGIRRLPSPLGVYFWIILLTTYGFTSYNGAKGQFFGLVVKHGTSKDADQCGQIHKAPCSQAQMAFNDGIRVAGLVDTLQLVAVFFVMALPFLVQRFGAKRVITTSIVPQAMYIVLAFSKNVPLDVTIAVACGLTQATISLLIVPLIVHVVGHSQDNMLGLLNGALNSALCIGQLVNYVVAAALVTSSMGHALPIVVGGTVSFVAFGVALFFFHVDMFSL